MKSYESYKSLGEYLSQMETCDFAEFSGMISFRSPSCTLTCGDGNKRFLLFRQSHTSYRVTSVSDHPSNSRDFDVTFVVTQPVTLRYDDPEKTLEIQLVDELSLRIRPHNIRF